MAPSHLKNIHAQNLTSTRAWQRETERREAVLQKRRRSASSLNGEVFATDAQHQHQQQRISPNSSELTESELEYGDIIILPSPPPVPASVRTLPSAIGSRMDARPASSPPLSASLSQPRRSAIMAAPRLEETSISAVATTTAPVTEVGAPVGPQTRSRTQVERGIAPSSSRPNWRRADKACAFCQEHDIECRLEIYTPGVPGRRRRRRCIACQHKSTGCEHAKNARAKRAKPPVPASVSAVPMPSVPACQQQSTTNKDKEGNSVSNNNSNNENQGTMTVVPAPRSGLPVRGQTMAHTGGARILLYDIGGSNPKADVTYRDRVSQSSHKDVKHSVTIEKNANQLRIEYSSYWEP